jgi:hypothetical protein
MGPEHLDSDRIYEHFGVHKLPMPLALSRSSHFYPIEYLGSGTSARVLVSIDLNERGVVEQVEAILPSPRPGNKSIRAVLIHPTGEQEVWEPGTVLDPLFARAAEASVREMRFSPAELDGQPVPLRGLRITIAFTDPQSTRA